MKMHSLPDSLNGQFSNEIVAKMQGTADCRNMEIAGRCKDRSKDAAESTENQKQNKTKNTQKKRKEKEKKKRKKKEKKKEKKKKKKKTTTTNFCRYIFVRKDCLY